MIVSIISFCSVAYSGFSKGGPIKFRKFENDEDQNQNFFRKSVFLPKFWWRPKKKKRSSLKFSRFLRPEKRSSPTVCVLKPSAQVPKREPISHICIIFYANYTILSTKRGAMAQCPPPNTLLYLLHTDIKILGINKQLSWQWRWWLLLTAFSFSVAKIYCQCSVFTVIFSLQKCKKILQDCKTTRLSISNRNTVQSKNERKSYIVYFRIQIHVCISTINLFINFKNK